MSVLVIAFAFLLGSIPFGVVIAKRLGVDIKAAGSGNIGATNVTRVLGVIPGAIVLALDAAKGALAVWLAARHGGPWIVSAAGFAAILGHCFSPWLGGHGGKGVATALGVFLVLSPPLAGVAAGVFLAVLAITRIPALGSIAGIATVALYLVYKTERPLAALACATLLLSLYTHRQNLAKLLR